jgi:hypothetical protein
MVLLCTLLLIYGVWALWRGLRSGRDPMYDYRRDSSPVLFWFFTGFWIATLIVGLAILTPLIAIRGS